MSDLLTDVLTVATYTKNRRAIVDCLVLARYIVEQQKKEKGDGQTPEHD